jgi:hypothetical protein
MAIAAIPPGVEIKKLSPTQERALDKLLKSQRDENTLQTAIRVAVPTLAFVGIAGIGIVTTFAYLKDIELPSVKDIVKGAGVDAGSIVADVITTIVGRDNPRTPEFTPSGAGPIPRCTRWESDYLNTLKDDPGPIETTLLATAQLNIIKNMKAEGCTRPSSIKQSQWDKV